MFTMFGGVEDQVRKLSGDFQAQLRDIDSLIRDLAKVEHNNTAAIRHDVNEQVQQLAREFEALQLQAAVPQGDTPTVEELLEQAKSDPTTRKAFENTLRNLEFEDPLVGFN